MVEVPLPETVMSTPTRRQMNSMAVPPEIRTFVQSAVRLPFERLKKVDREWDRLYPSRAVVAELIQSSERIRQQVSELRDYILAEARLVAAERTEEHLIPEDITDAVAPAARALLLRGALQESGDQRRAQAFAALTEPFVDILPRPRDAADRRGDR
jgi:hypothetical protein